MKAIAMLASWVAVLLVYAVGSAVFVALAMGGDWIAWPGVALGVWQLVRYWRLFVAMLWP